MKRDTKQGFDQMKIIESLLRQIEGKDAQIEVLVDEVKSLEKTVSRLSDEISTLRRALYGTSSERSVTINNKEGGNDKMSNDEEDDNNGDDGDAQPDCDNSAENNEVGECPASQNEKKNTHRYHHPTKRDYSAIKPSRVIRIHPSDDEMEGARFVKVVRSFRFVHIPAHIEKVLIERYVYEKDGKLITPQLPYAPETFEKRRMDATLAAGLLTGKYQYHIPVERLIGMLSQGKLKLAKTTLHDYMVAGIDALDGLYEAIREKVLSDNYSHIDQTVQHLVDREQHRCRNAYDWGFVSPTYKMMFFTTSNGSRGQEVLDKQLTDFKGHYINTDGYSAYENAGERNNLEIIQIPCMSHIRRKFVDALKYHEELASQGLAKINRIFWFERAMRKRGLNTKETIKHRKRYLRDMLDDLKSWLQKQNEDTEFFKNDNIGKAINYAWQRIDKFYELLHNGRLVIQNNLAERCMRGHTVGRKNYLFCQNIASEERACKIYSIIESCKLSGIDPYRYLCYIYTQRPEDFKSWDELLPCTIKHRLK